jgi:hypothetical protein
MRDHDRPAPDLMEPGQVTVNVPTIIAAGVPLSRQAAWSERSATGTANTSASVASVASAASAEPG